MAGDHTLQVIKGSGPSHIQSIRRRFLVLNQERLNRVQTSLRSRQKIFLEIFPLLFHINSMDLPGFVSKKTPIGICDYSPSKKSITDAGKLSKNFKYQRKAMRGFAIHALYLMGSSGTIAYSEKSDFDIWVCHDPKLKKSQIALLREKSDAISKWADSIGLEVTFFVLSAETMKQGTTESLSEESSGTAQDILLKEEFYRTSLYIAGRTPAWWLVPPEHEHEYDEYIEGLIKKGLIDEIDIIDFGSVGHLPAGEFFGAGLWQLHKALGSPYKSVLKLMVMEAYANEYPDVQLLSNQMKQAVYGGETSIDALDSYILIYNKLEDYLRQRNELERLDFVRRCFYFKVNLKLSNSKSIRAQYRYEIMSELTKGWGWKADDYKYLDSHSRWKVNQVMEERKVITSELTRSYRVLSDFAREHAEESNINSMDLNLLGRRLYAAFERKAGKVELVNQGISSDMTEERIKFVQSSSSGQDTWLLYRDNAVSEAESDEAPLKRTHSLIELVSWCHFNKIIGSQTLVSLNSREPNFTLKELLAIIDSIKRLYIDGKLPRISMKMLQDRSRILSCALYINLGVDPWVSHTKKGLHLTSNKSDALSYGGISKNLIIGCDMMMVSSWGEVLTFRYSGETALLDCLCDYHAWAPLSDKKSPPPVQVYSFSSAQGMAIAHRVEELFRDTIQTYYKSDRGKEARYVIRIEHSNYLLQEENDAPRFRKLGDKADLINALGAAQTEFSPIVFDRYMLDEMPLSKLIQHNSPDVVQLFFQVKGEKAVVYVLDERGSLFYQIAEYFNSESLVAQYKKFLDNAVNRRNMMEQADEAKETEAEIQYYQIHKLRGNQIRLERLDGPKSSDVGSYFGIQVIGDVINGERPTFTLYCDGEEFSYLEFGDDVFKEVAQYVLDKRKDRGRYPIYITDIDVTRPLLGVDGVLNLQTIHFLNYKRNIEHKLNIAMSNL